MNLAIVGGGASGLMCAACIGRLCEKDNIKINITIFEKNSRVGKKLLITGNGRCNMMNINKDGFHFNKDSFSHFALNKFNVKNNLLFFEKLGILTRSDDEGRIYPLSNQASSVSDALRFECERLKIKTVTDCEITSVVPCKGGYMLNGTKFFDALVLSCGGQAAVRNFNGYELLRSLGHKVTSLKPSLTKLTVKEKKFVKPLKGVRQKGIFKLYADGKYIMTEKGELQFTDYGLSGIAIMQFSSYIAHLEKTDNVVIECDFASDVEFEKLYSFLKSFVFAHPDEKAVNLLSGVINKKLGESILKKVAISFESPLKRIKETDITNISKCIKKCRFNFEELKGFDDAQVTAGGADTRQFDDKTMMSKIHKNLYCTGELLDVDGLCGGYNLHWAWSSGRLAAESIVKEIQNRKG